MIVLNSMAIIANNFANNEMNPANGASASNSETNMAANGARATSRQAHGQQIRSLLV